MVAADVEVRTHGLRINHDIRRHIEGRRVGGGRIGHIGLVALVRNGVGHHAMVITGIGALDGLEFQQAAGGAGDIHPCGESVFPLLPLVADHTNGRTRWAGQGRVLARLILAAHGLGINGNRGRIATRDRDRGAVQINGGTARGGGGHRFVVAHLRVARRGIKINHGVIGGTRGADHLGQRGRGRPGIPLVGGPGNTRGFGLEEGLGTVINGRGRLDQIGGPVELNTGARQHKPIGPVQARLHIGGVVGLAIQVQVTIGRQPRGEAGAETVLTDGVPVQPVIQNALLDIGHGRIYIQDIHILGTAGRIPSKANAQRRAKGLRNRNIRNRRVIFLVDLLKVQVRQPRLDVHFRFRLANQGKHQAHDVRQHPLVEGLENEGLHIIHTALLTDGQVGGEQVTQVFTQPRRARSAIQQAVLAPQARDVHCLIKARSAYKNDATIYAQVNILVIQTRSKCCGVGPRRPVVRR